VETTFEAFVAQRMDRLLRLARLLTGNATDAEDLVQNSLLRAHAKWAKIAAADHPDAYLRRLLINVHHSSLRKRRLSVVELEPHDLSFASHDREVAELDALRGSVIRLPIRQRTAVVLRYYEDLDIHEIADAMGLHQSSVRSSLARALSTLRDANELTQKAGDEHA
jgi:RNA polymerase sigma-70 factor (sigma-E family)